MTKKTIKLIAILMFVICLLFQATLIIGICRDEADTVQSIFRIVLLIVAEVIIVKAYPAYLRHYGGPKY